MDSEADEALPYSNVALEEPDAPLFFADALQIFLVPGIRIADPETVAGRIWEATLQYILHLSCVTSCYVSQQTEEDHVWLLLTWKNNEDRDRFYGGTLGIGVMMYFLAAPPRVYGLSSELPETVRDGAELRLSHYTFSELLSPDHQLQLEEHWLKSTPRHSICCGWELVTSNFTPRNPTPGATSFVAIEPRTRASMSSDAQESALPLDIPAHNHTLLTIHQPRKENHPMNTPFTLPVSTAALLNTPSWIYGISEYDDSEIGRDAYPLDVTFRPMASLEHDGWFPYQTPPDLEIESSSRCWMTVLTVYLAMNREGAEGKEDDVLAQLCQSIGIQPGLRQLYWERGECDARMLRFFASWTDEVSCIDFSDTSLKASGLITQDSDLVSFPHNNCRLDWDNEGTLELIEFRMSPKLAPVEKYAFQCYMSRFTDLMTESMSHMDEVITATSYGPYTDPSSSPDLHILLLDWTSPVHRNAWFQNFLAHEYFTLGHVAHSISLACRDIRSSTHALREVNTRAYAPAVEEDDGGSDCDMGF